MQYRYFETKIYNPLPGQGVHTGSWPWAGNVIFSYLNEQTSQSVVSWLGIPRPTQENLMASLLSDHRTSRYLGPPAQELMSGPHQPMSHAAWKCKTFFLGTLMLVSLTSMLIKPQSTPTELVAIGDISWNVIKCHDKSWSVGDFSAARP